MSTQLNCTRYVHTGEKRLIGDFNMKIVKMLIASVALSGALATTAQARDSFSIGINIGGHDHHSRHTLRTHRHAPVYYGHYYSEPRVIYYAPSVRYRHYDRHGYYGDRHHYKRHGKKHHRRHYRGHRDGHRDGHRGRRGHH